MAQPYLLARDTVNGAEGNVVITIDGKNSVIAGMRNIKTTVDVQSEDMRVVGTRRIQQKPNGALQHGTGNIYYGSNVFTDMVLQYINTGVMPQFDIQITNNDEATTIGSQVMAYYGCTLLGEIPLAMLDDEDSMMNYDFEFTWTSTERLQAFNEPEKYGNDQ